MNPQNFQDLTPEDRAFALGAQARLRASETLSYTEAARLAATRAQASALVQSSSSHPLPRWGWIAAPAALALAMVVVQLAPRWTATPATVPLSPMAVNATSGTALELLTDEAGPDFYRDLAFYEWLERQSRPEPHA